MLEDDDYTIRFRAIDQFGNVLEAAHHDFSTRRPASIAMSTTPRVYDSADNLQPGLTGVIPGRYVGLNISVDGQPGHSGRVPHCRRGGRLCGGGTERVRPAQP